jgi:hypothetical protein
MSLPALTRRRVLRNAALGTASVLSAPYVRAQYSAGKLQIGAWDHSVPAANEMLTTLCQAWAETNHVEVKIDFLTSTLSASAEAQAREGHDIIAHPTWQVVLNRHMLEPVDDIVADLINNYGPMSPMATYLAKSDGAWRAVPATIGSVVKPCCSRLDLYKQYCGLDLSNVFPANDHRDQALVDGWNWELYLKTAEQLYNAGSPVGLPMGQFSDAVDWVGGLFQCFGAVLVDDQGVIKVDSEETRTALEFVKKLMAFTPAGVYAWDDTSNNHFLISGKGSGIINPPTAWSAAARENPAVAERCWTHDVPRGPRGRFVAEAPFFLWHLELCDQQGRRKVAAGVHLCTRAGGPPGRRSERRRYPTLRKLLRLRYLAEGWTATGDTLQLSATRRYDHHGARLASTPRRCSADFQPSSPTDNGRQVDAKR